jgi:hypothetical protein
MGQPTYPAPLPTLTTWTSSIWLSAPFTLRRPVLATPFVGGQTQRVEIADGYWTMRFTTVLLEYNEVLELLGWFDSLRGGMQLFVATDPARPYPIAYTAAQFAALTNFAEPPVWNGTADVTDLSVANRIQCANVPDNFALARGDYVELAEDNNRCLFRIAGSSVEFTGGTLNCWVEPDVPSFFTTAAVANFDHPACLAVVDKDSFEGEPGLTPVSCSFTARQQVWQP